MEYVSTNDSWVYENIKDTLKQKHYLLLDDVEENIWNRNIKKLDLEQLNS